MILADENVHGFIIKTLRENGVAVVSVREQASGIKDEQVIELALKYNYILLTEDKDFGEWIFAHHVSNLSVLFLRYAFEEYKEIAYATNLLLQNHQLEQPFFATITTKKIRIRKL